jgi:hypothetical protein
MEKRLGQDRVFLIMRPVLQKKGRVQLTADLEVRHQNWMKLSKRRERYCGMINVLLSEQLRRTEYQQENLYG